MNGTLTIIYLTIMVLVESPFEGRCTLILLPTRSRSQLKLHQMTSIGLLGLAILQMCLKNEVCQACLGWSGPYACFASHHDYQYYHLINIMGCNILEVDIKKKKEWEETIILLLSKTNTVGEYHFLLELVPFPLPLRTLLRWCWNFLGCDSHVPQPLSDEFGRYPLISSMMNFLHNDASDLLLPVWRVKPPNITSLGDVSMSTVKFTSVIIVGPKVHLVDYGNWSFMLTSMYARTSF